MKILSLFAFVSLSLTAAVGASSPTPAANGGPTIEAPGETDLSDVRLRDSFVWADPVSKTYYLVSSTNRVGPHRRPAVIQFTSRDLKTWHGPRVVFEIPADFWTQRGIWAPELHAYRGKFYLFLTFDSDQLLSEQWRDWLPRVKRGSQILVADAPTGPFQPFANRSTLPDDMMTLDGTFFLEDNVPYMVFAHEWVQIKDGTIEYVRLADDLSKTDGEPKRLFNGSDAPWGQVSAEFGCHVTDAPWLYRTKTGRLLMLWSSFGAGGYTVGIAASESGKIAGPWHQQTAPLFTADGGHPMLFHRFDGQLMMILHQPNKRLERARFFEIEDTGDSLKIKNR